MARSGSRHPHPRFAMPVAIAFAEARGHSLLELAFSWLLAHGPVASVIAGATKPEQIRANVGAAAWQLTHADLAAINAILDRPR